MELSIEAEEYLIACKYLKGLNQLTLKAYKIDLNQFVGFMKNKDCMSKDYIIDYINVLHKTYKPKSAKRKIACIKAFYRYMEIENIIDVNPFHKIKIKYKEPIVLPKTIPVTNIESLLKYAYQKHEMATTKYQEFISLRNVLVLEILFSTGMRVSEVSNIRFSDVDLNSNSIYVFGKGSKERIVCIANKDIVKLLKKYIEITHNKSDYLFLNKLGNKYSEQSIRNMVDSYTKAAGIDMHITPHMFRHTFATVLLDEDVNIRYIQHMLGHSSVLTTQIYTHTSTNRIYQILSSKHPRNSLKINN